MYSFIWKHQGKGESAREHMRETFYTLVHSPQGCSSLWLDQVEARSFTQDCHVGGRGPDAWSVSCYFPKPQLEPETEVVHQGHKLLPKQGAGVPNSDFTCDASTLASVLFLTRFTQMDIIVQKLTVGSLPELTLTVRLVQDLRSLWVCKDNQGGGITGYSCCCHQQSFAYQHQLQMLPFSVSKVVLNQFILLPLCTELREITKAQLVTNRKAQNLAQKKCL